MSSSLHESDVDDFILKYLLIFEICERFVVRYVKGLFTNMQKQQNIVKISRLNSRILMIKNAKLSGYCLYMNTNI